MPALVKSSVGSFCGTSGALGTGRWSRLRKNSWKLLRISVLFMVWRLLRLEALVERGVLLGSLQLDLFVKACGAPRSLFQHGNDSTAGEALPRQVASQG